MTDMPEAQNTDHIRPRQQSDLAECAAALVKVHATDGYPVEGVDDPKAWLTPQGQLQAWVAEIEGKIVGHVLLTEPQKGDAAAQLWLKQNTGKVAVLGRLFVLSEARGKSLGERLITEAMSYGERHGIQLVLDVVEKDRAAIRLYEKMGWKRIGEASHAYGSGSSIKAFLYAA